MLTVIQVVSHANVSVNKKTIGAIQKGIVALIGIEKTDTEQDAKKIVDKILQYRIFSDQNNKTNLSLKDVQGGLLLVPQFTLVAETQKGLRPGYSTGMPPEAGKILFEYLVKYASENYSLVASGEFGAYMQVSLCNDGPMTFILKTNAGSA